jgi:hypothetical protein
MATNTNELITQSYIQIEKVPMLTVLKTFGVLPKEEWQSLMVYHEKHFCFI